jgi:hypothetical protein
MDETLMIEAAQSAIELFEREYDGATCAVCQAEKWIQAPFCRGCSIKLQRAGLMKRFVGLLADVRHVMGIGEEEVKDWHRWPTWYLRTYWRHYDLCRDFLIDVKRHFNSAKESNDNG